MIKHYKKKRKIRDMDWKCTLWGHGCNFPGIKPLLHKLQPDKGSEQRENTKLTEQKTQAEDSQQWSEAGMNNRLKANGVQHCKNAQLRHLSDFTHCSERKHKTVAKGAAHRVVSPGYGWLSGGVRIHCVNDCLPLPFLVDLPKAPPGLSVRGLSLKVLLIFIHIVHLEVLGGQRNRKKGSDCSCLHSHLPSLPPPPPCLPSLSSCKNRSVSAGYTMHIYVKGCSEHKKREGDGKTQRAGWAIWIERGRWRHKKWGVKWVTGTDRRSLVKSDMKAETEELNSTASLLDVSTLTKLYVKTKSNTCFQS